MAVVRNRPAFERWARLYWGKTARIERDDIWSKGGYADPAVDLAWRAWCAARNDMKAAPR